MKYYFEKLKQLIIFYLETIKLLMKDNYCYLVKIKDSLINIFKNIKPFFVLLFALIKVPYVCFKDLKNIKVKETRYYQILDLIKDIDIKNDLKKCRSIQDVENIFNKYNILDDDTKNVILLITLNYTFEKNIVMFLAYNNIKKYISDLLINNSLSNVITFSLNKVKELQKK